jgi:lipoate---protein ligase
MKLLDLTFPSPAENLACDEALLDEAEAGSGGELLRFWEAREHFVVVGYSNKVVTEVNVPACEAKGIPILRRCSGGGSVLQGPGCLNYTLVLEITDDGPLRTIAAANRFIMERNRAAVETAIGNRQPPITVQGHTDLAIGGRKFSGNSQRRRKLYLLFHGTFLLHFNLPLLSQFLLMPSKQPSYREGRSHQDFLLNLDVSADSLKTALRDVWSATTPLQRIPSNRMAALVMQKYGRSDWNFKF